jgi:ectoine hydroxylase-related dioxygenase (phytanoyl-CoA dioxygenase family)
MTIVQGPIRINNSELRVRYHANATSQHMGGPIDHKYRYSFNRDGIDAMMVRMVYFLHDVTHEQGPFSVVPATHKSNFTSPYQTRVEDEPGMIGLEVKAGDALVFTENLRHGGLPNRSTQARKTLHVGYGPYWMMSQNTATRDEPQYVLPETLERYNEDQRALFVIRPQEEG